MAIFDRLQLGMDNFHQFGMIIFISSESLFSWLGIRNKWGPLQPKELGPFRVFCIYTPVLLTLQPYLGTSMKIECRVCYRLRLASSLQLPLTKYK